MKIGISSIFQALSPSPYSHGSGIARIFAKQVHEATQIKPEILWTKEDRDWNEFDMIFLWQGLPMNGKGMGINMFGGATESNERALSKLAYFNGAVKPIGCSLLPYDELSTRLWPGKGMSTHGWERLAKLRGTLKSTYEWNPQLHAATITVGDSHAPSVWIEGGHLSVNYGMTLHRALETGLSNIPITRQSGRYSHITFYFGNIDVRHHLCRLQDPLAAARALAEKYVDQALALSKTGINVELCTIHPIEDELRKIPTPGRYKGTNFFGSWRERNTVRMEFNDAMTDFIGTDPRLTIHEYPRNWIEPATRKMDQEFLERPRSVHIAPKYYRADLFN